MNQRQLRRDLRKDLRSIIEDHALQSYDQYQDECRVLYPEDFRKMLDVLVENMSWYVNDYAKPITQVYPSSSD